MGILRRIGRSIGNTSKLQRKYYLLTTSLGWLVVIIGALLIVLLMYKTRLAFGLPLGSASLEGRRIQFLGWIGVTLISIPVIFYASMVFVAGAFGLVMVLRGKFTMAEAGAYALYGEFPQYWYRQDA